MSPDTRNNHPSLRNEIEKCLSDNNIIEGKILLESLWRDNPRQDTAEFVITCLEKYKKYLKPKKCRIAIVRSFTLEPMIPLLRASALLNGIDLEIYIGNFNTYFQELLEPKSSLYKFSPDIVFLAIQTRDIAPELYTRFSEHTPQESAVIVKRVYNDLISCLEVFSHHSTANLVLHNFEIPAYRVNGILDSQSDKGQVETIREINRNIQHLAETQRGVFVLDYDFLTCRYGKMKWNDEKKWRLARMPIAADNLIYLTKEWLKYIHPMTGKVCKVLVTDLDNTIWGGVIGEDGIEGIRLGEDSRGIGFLDLQRAILELSRRGVILAICSKNNYSDAIDALSKHPASLLRPEHFPVMRINWNDKPTNLIEIAEELNLGLDSMAFLDDNPVERQLVKLQLPEVVVIDLPSDPQGYSLALYECPYFERLKLTKEDKLKNTQYIEQKNRSEFKSTFKNEVDFFKSLEMTVDIFKAKIDTIPLFAQKTQKTNQFNLTTRRYNEQELANFLGNDNIIILGAQVRDRFGDNGLVGVSILKFDEDACEIDTFLLSCRVIGRTVETSILAAILQLCRDRQINWIYGWYLPTAKNMPARDFYKLNGFKCVKSKTGNRLWKLRVSESNIECPNWIKLNISGETETNG